MLLDLIWTIVTVNFITLLTNEEDWKVNSLFFHKPGTTRQQKELKATDTRKKKRNLLSNYKSNGSEFQLIHVGWSCYCGLIKLKIDIDFPSSYACAPSSSRRVLLMAFAAGPRNWIGPDQKWKWSNSETQHFIFHKPPCLWHNQYYWNWSQAGIWQKKKGYDKPGLT